MLEAETKHQQPFPGLAENLLKTKGGSQLLPAKVIYGANASGKSNLLQGLGVIRSLMTTDSLAIDFSLIHPFLRSDYHEHKATELELELVIGEDTFQYGIAITRNELKREWLYVTSGLTGRTATAFVREGTTIEFGSKLSKAWSPLPSLIKKGSTALVRPDTLLLLQASNLGVAAAKTIIEAVDKITLLNSDALPRTLRPQLMHRFKHSSELNQVLEFLRGVGIKMESLRYLDRDSVVKLGFSSDQEEEIMAKFTSPTILVTHTSVDQDGQPAKPIAWTLESNESEGTQKLFWLAIFLIDTLNNGGILVIDEFEANLHPHLSEAIIDLYQYHQTNPGGGQLIVATHDTNLLQPSLLRRDQIAFVEKDEQGASEIYNLSDLEGVRGASPYERQYTSGKYGSVPQLSYPLIKVQSRQ